MEMTIDYSMDKPIRSNGANDLRNATEQFQIAFIKITALHGIEETWEYSNEP